MKTLTTGEIAKLCDVHLRTVIRWIEKGELKGFKLPGRGNNRILEEDFIDFLTRHEMPIPASLAKPEPLILIVDDEAAIVRTLARTLHKAGYNTLTASNGFEAGSLLSEHKPTLMTLDLSMPGLDGYEVIRFVRSHPTLKQIKILVISALSPERRQDALDLGADLALPKPFTHEALIEAIEQLLT